MSTYGVKSVHVGTARKILISNPWVAGSSPAGRDKLRQPFFPSGNPPSVCFVRIRKAFPQGNEAVSPTRPLYFTAKRLEINSPGLQAWVWSLAIYSFVFRDSAPKARYQNSLVHRIISKRPTVGFKRVHVGDTRKILISNPWVAGSSPAGRERLTDSTQIALRRLRGGHSVCRLTGEQRQTPRCYSDFQPCLCAAFLVLSSQPLAQLIARRITLLASASSFCPTITSAHKGHNPGQSFSHWHEGHLCGVSLSFKLIPVRFPFVVRI